MTATTGSTTDSLLRSDPRWTRANLQGLGIAAFLGLADILGIFLPVDPGPGQDGPPAGVLVLGVLLGLLTIGLVARAWRTGSRGNLRAVAGLRIFSVVTGLPAFFVDIQGWVKVLTAVQLLVTLACLVLMLRPAQRGPVLD